MRTVCFFTVIFAAVSTMCQAQESVYAPQFLGQLPTVVITDRLASGTGYDAPAGGWDGPERPESAFLFRYENAVDVSSLIDLSGVADPAEVRVAFTEYDNTDDLTPNEGKTLSINGRKALDEVPVSAGVYTEDGSFALGDGVLDLRNIDFSPGGGMGPFDPVGDVTGENILAHGEQQRVVTLHLGDQHLAGGYTASDRSFLVVTSLEGSDRVALGDDDQEVLLQAGRKYDDDFSGWQIYSKNALVDYPRNGILTDENLISSDDFSGVEILPGLELKNQESVAIPEKSGEIYMSTLKGNDLSQVGVFSLELLATTRMEKDAIYEARVSVRSGHDPQQGEVFVQMGNMLVSGVGTVGLKANPFDEETELEYPCLGKQNQMLNVYLLPKSTVEADDNIFRVLLVDYDDKAGQDIYIDGMEIRKIAGSREDLGKGTVLCDLGGEIDGEEVEPDDSALRKPFIGSSEPGESVRLTIDGMNKAVPTHNSVTGGALLSAMGFDTPREEGGYITYSQFETFSNESLNLDELETGIETDPDCLYILDVYARVDRPGAVLPNLAPFVLNDLTHLAGGVWKIGEVGDEQYKGLARSTELKLGMESKVYSVVFRPQTSNEKAKTCIAIQLFTAETLPNLTTATITIPRIRLVEY